MERASSPLLQANTSMPVYHQPKGRGRPRASYAQTGEFDLGLIREYQSRPALYDRSNKRFKDKMHVAQLWLQISHKLGYDASILRERMITLRNRYNIEKRRLENNSLSSSIVVGSQWPLFDNLSFLSEHIRSRRSYKTQSKSLDGRMDDDDDEEPFDVDDMNSESNGHVKDIKHELDNEYDDMEEYDCDRQLPVTTVLNIPLGAEVNTKQNNYGSQINGNDMVNGKNSQSFHLAGYRQPELVVAVSKQKRAQQKHEEEPQASKRRLLEAAERAAIAATTIPINTPITYPKFRAFGEFVSHSLTELPHSVSMRLVEKFTRELVQATIASEDNAQDKQGSTEQSSMDEMDD